IDSILETTPRVDVPVMNTVESLLLTTPNLPPPFIPIISQVQQAPAPLPATTPSTSQQDLLNFEEPMHTTQDLEEPAHQEFETGATDDQPIAEASQHLEWYHKQTKPPTLDRAWNKTLPATHGSIQPWISNLAKKADSRTSFDEMMDTPDSFLAFVMNRLKVDTLTPELLAGPTYELMRGSCKSSMELEFFLEKVYKATTYQLDWNNLKDTNIRMICSSLYH
nr:hypothetical protein [Tanacetum cinerariifolium]